MAISYKVSTGILTFPDRSPAMEGDILTAEEVAPYLPRLVDLGALHPVSDDQAEVAESDDEPKSEPEPEKPASGAEKAVTDEPAKPVGEQGDEPEDELDAMTVAELKGLALSLDIHPVPDRKADLKAAITAKRAEG